MDDFLSQRDLPEDAPAPAFRRGKNLIAVASGKGGVGKTFFSITLTQALAKQGKRVLLFDGDLGLANVDVQLGLMPKRDLNDVIRGRLGLDKVIQSYE
ncbi:MAG TPA: P-loop NTPase, partial [Patescibacteria group bacterium]|nr:P-loop NTPase [Patescibacteria group bacterium]